MPTRRWPDPDRALAAARSSSEGIANQLLHRRRDASETCHRTAKATRSSRDLGVILRQTRTGKWFAAVSGATGETSDAFSRGERTYHPGRPGHTNGRHPAALLAACLAVARDSRAG